MNMIKALAGGFAGACALTAIHQLIKSKDKDAPRMDLLGVESLAKILTAFGCNMPEGDNLYRATLAGDIISNSFYYSLIGMGDKKTWLKGISMGMAAGLGAVYLPKPLGLNQAYSNRTPETRLLAILYYLAGGMVTAGMLELLKKYSPDK